MQTLERYNQLLKVSEANVIKLLNTAIDFSFKRLVKRVRQHLNQPEKINTVNRNLLVLQDLNTLIPAVDPNKADVYDNIFYKLLNTSTTYGLDVARITTAEFADKQINASIPLEAVAAQAKQAHGYLRKHGQVFAETSTEIVMKGMIEGRPTDKIVQEMQYRLNVTKSRARMIVKTESLRSYNEAADQYYAQLGVEYVSWYATSDDRTCPYCSPRAGLIYKRTEVKVPLHVQCRCVLSPYSPELAEIDSNHREAPSRHRKEVEQETGRQLKDPASVLNKFPAGFFEQVSPTPVQPTSLV